MKISELHRYNKGADSEICSLSESLPTIKAK